MMYFERTIKSARTFFARWEGADAEMWTLTVSHKSLSIVLRRRGQEGNLLIGCLGPITIRGPVRWGNCHLQIAVTTLPESEERGLVITDNSVDLEVVCCSVEVKENMKL